MLTAILIVFSLLLITVLVLIRIDTVVLNRIKKSKAERARFIKVYEFSELLNAKIMEYNIRHVEDIYYGRTLIGQLKFASKIPPFDQLMIANYEPELEIFLTDEELYELEH